MTRTVNYAPTIKATYNKHYPKTTKGKLKPISKESVKGLRVYKTKKGVRSQGYKYLVTSFGGTGHSAFETKKGFDQYLKDHGLHISKQKPGWTGAQKLIGTEKKVAYAGSQAQLDALAKSKGYKPTKVLSNGNYVRGYIKKTKTGSEILYMNPNYKPRVLKYVRK